MLHLVWRSEDSRMVNASPGCSCCFPSLHIQRWTGVRLEQALLANRSAWTNRFVLSTFPELRVFLLFLAQVTSTYLPNLTSLRSRWNQPSSIWAWDPASVGCSQSQLSRICRLCCALFPLLCAELKGNQTPITIRRDNPSVFSTCLVPSEGRGWGRWKAMSSIPAMSATLHGIRGSWRIAKESSNSINHFSCVELL